MGFCLHLVAVAALSTLFPIALTNQEPECGFHGDTYNGNSMVEEALSLVQLRTGIQHGTSVRSGQVNLSDPYAHGHNITDPNLYKESHDGPLYVWIMLGRVGSTSMREILTKRAARHGFHVKREDTDPLHRFAYDSALCHWRGQVDDPEGSTPPRCTTQPEGSVITAIYPGYCEKFAPSRPCKYFTLLREPIQRMVSEYAHFCLSCLENAMRCAVQPEEKELWNIKHPGMPLPTTCPNISLVEYARRRNNPYTRRFSRVDSRKIMEGAWWVSGYYTKLSEEHYQSARETLTADNMLILWLENLSTREGEKPNGLEMLADYLKDDGLVHDAAGIHANPSPGTPTFDKATRLELERILSWDLRLYDFLVFKSLYQKN